MLTDWILKYREAIDENIFVNMEYLTDTIILLSTAVIVVPLLQSLGLEAITGFWPGASIRPIRAGVYS
jgi:hypothetical protein